LPLIALGYILPVGAALSASGNWAEWKTGYLPQAAQALGGSWLAGFVMLGALLASAGLTLPAPHELAPAFALAVDGQMPAVLARIHPRFGTPWVAVLVSSACYSVFAYWSFKELIVLDMWLYALTLVLELGAFVALRMREPELPRPWRVGGSAAGMWAVVASGRVCAARDGDRRMDEHDDRTAGAAPTGPAAYWAWRWSRRASPGERPSPALSPEGGF
jgi:amino acid transporter